MPGDSAVELYWLPLGAGGWFVRLNGRAYEAVAARLQWREPRDLYHAALRIRVDGAEYAIEQAPAARPSEPARGVVAGGAVGSRLLGGLRVFRYEVRVWRGGRIPDAEEAVDSPRLLSHDGGVARRVLRAVPRVPTPVWGRDELGTGEMWNSNSIVAWSLASAGVDAEEIAPPEGGRAPGWFAGLSVARGAGVRR